MGYVIGVFVFLIVLVISVGLHEAGHMVVARKFKLSVPKFAVGFGPRLFSFTRNKTEYSIRAIPLGGFVEMIDSSAKIENVKNEKGVTDEEKLEFEKILLSQVHPVKRFIVFVAGPAVNIVLATFILVGVLWAVPMLEANTTIDEINTCKGNEQSCSASEAGLKPNDQITAVNNTPVSDFEEMSTEIAKADENNDKIIFDVNRDGKELSQIQVPLHEGKIGANFESRRVDRTFPQAFAEYGGMLNEQLRAIATLPSRVEGTLQVYFGKDRSPEALSSVVTVGRVYGHVGISDDSNLEKVQQWAYYAGALNIALGFINLLPLLPFDGGRILVAFIDLVKMGLAKLRKNKYSPLSIEMVKSMTLTMQVPVVIIGFLIVLAEIVFPYPLG